MDIKELKKSIENKTVLSDGLIFKSKSIFIPIQYINNIANLYNKDVEYVDSLNRVIKINSIFGEIERYTCCVFITDKLDHTVELDDLCFIICKECNNNDYIDVPKIERWQEIDYAVSNSSKNISYDLICDIVDSCNDDLYLLDNEISKYNIFSLSNQKQIFNSLFENNQIIRSYKETIFDFVNAILDKDIEKVSNIYSNLDKYGIDPMALIAIIKKQLTNIILVGFNKNPTEENTGLTTKQIYWIKKNLYKYNSTNLVNSFNFICNVDELLMKGILSSKQLLDYVVVNLL